MSSVKLFTLVMLSLCLPMNTQPANEECSTSHDCDMVNRLRILESMLKKEQQERIKQELCLRVNTQTTNQNYDTEPCIKNLEDQLKKLEGKLAKLEGDFINKSHVAFSAHMIVGEIRPNIGNIVPFKKIVVNEGGHFDISTSKFTCPRTGMYYFVFNIHSNNLRAGTSAYHTSAELMVNGKSMVRAHCRAGVPSGETEFMCGQSFVVKCGTNEQVWIQAAWGNSGNQMYGTDSNAAYSSFSGILLF